MSESNVRIIYRKINRLRKQEKPVQGISNNPGAENKPDFVTEAKKDYAMQSRSTQYMLKEMAEARGGK